MKKTMGLILLSTTLLFSVSAFAKLRPGASAKEASGTVIESKILAGHKKSVCDALGMEGTACDELVGDHLANHKDDVCDALGMEGTACDELVGDHLSNNKDAVCDALGIDGTACDELVGDHLSNNKDAVCDALGIDGTACDELVGDHLSNNKDAVCDTLKIEKSLCSRSYDVIVSYRKYLEGDSKAVYELRASLENLHRAQGPITDKQKAAVRDFLHAMNTNKLGLEQLSENAFSIANKDTGTN